MVKPVVADAETTTPGADEGRKPVHFPRVPVWVQVATGERGRAGGGEAV